MDTSSPEDIYKESIEQLDAAVQSLFDQPQPGTLDLSYCETLNTDRDLQAHLLQILVKTELMRNHEGHKVVEIDLGGNHFEAQEIKPLAKHIFPYLCNLTTLDLRDNKIGPVGIQLLLLQYLSFWAKRNLEVLDISENYIRDEGMSSVAKFLQGNKRLRWLSLSTNALSIRCVEPLAAGLKTGTCGPMLKELYLDWNNLGDEGLVALTRQVFAQGYLPNLEKLGLSSNGIRDDGAKTFTEEYLANPKVKKNNLSFLNLSVNKIGSVGAKAMASALTTSACQLRYLDLGCNPLQKEGNTALIANLTKFSHLEGLDLCSNDLDLDDAKAFRDQLMLIRKARKERLEKTRRNSGRKEEKEKGENLPSHISPLYAFEWYNNPKMEGDVEREIYEELQEIQTIGQAEEEIQNDQGFQNRRARNIVFVVVEVAVFGLLYWKFGQRH